MTGGATCFRAPVDAHDFFRADFLGEDDDEPVTCCCCCCWVIGINSTPFSLSVMVESPLEEPSPSDPSLFNFKSALIVVLLLLLLMLLLPPPRPDCCCVDDDELRLIRMDLTPLASLLAEVECAGSAPEMVTLLLLGDTFGCCCCGYDTAADETAPLDCFNIDFCCLAIDEDDDLAFSCGC